jgi:2,4-diketo-3-deoxy-L-fuconate hydrolase
MRIANLEGRLALVTDEGAIDVATASGGSLPPDPHAAFERWDELRAWAQAPQGDPRPFDESQLGPPMPRPRQVFGIGLNYASHAAETGNPLPEFPAAFTKFPTSIAPPRATVTLPSAKVDWEIELVVVVGLHSYEVDASDAWSHVAGLTVGQDLSERKVQMRPPLPQFSLGKSYPGFGPTGPVVVTPDEFDDPDDLILHCSLNGDEVQRGRTDDLIFSVPALVAHLSSIVPLLPGDLIFTGTPSGVGVSRKPPRFLAPGDELLSTIEGIGTIGTRFRSRDGANAVVDAEVAVSAEGPKGVEPGGGLAPM